MRLIDADALKEKLSEITITGDRDVIGYIADVIKGVGVSIIQAIDSMPTVEAEPVRHGYWIDKFGDGDLYCSECGAVMEKHEHINHNLYYCYHCGAKMDGVKDK